MVNSSNFINFYLKLPGMTATTNITFNNHPCMRLVCCCCMP